MEQDKKHPIFKNDRTKGNKKDFWRTYVRQMLNLRIKEVQTQRKNHIAQIALMRYMLKLPRKYRYMVDVASHFNLAAGTLWNCLVDGYVPNIRTRDNIQRITGIDAMAWPKRTYELPLGKRNAYNTRRMVKLVGEKFGLMTIVEEIMNPDRKARHRYNYICRCDCGNVETRTRATVRSMRTQKTGMCKECGHKKKFKTLTRYQYTSNRVDAK